MERKGKKGNPLKTKVLKLASSIDKNFTGLTCTYCQQLKQELP